MSGLVAAVVMMSLHDRPVECAPRLAPTAKALAIGQPQPKQSPAAYSKKRKASPSASTPPITVYSGALAPEPKRSPAAYSDRSKKSGHIYEIETESSRGIPGSNQASRPKGSVRHAVARRMALVPWRQDDQLVSPPATQRDEPGTLSRHALEETQLKEWTTRVLQAAMLDTTRLPKQLTEASQYAMRATTLRVSGAGPILAAEWIWRSLTPAQQTKRAQILRKWKTQLQKEKEEMKAKHGKVSYPPGAPQSLFLSSAWKSQVNDLREWLCMISSEGFDDDQPAARLAVRLVASGFRYTDDLEGLQPGAVTQITAIPKEQAMLLQAVRVVDELAFETRHKRARRAAGLDDLAKIGPRSAFEIAAGLSPEALKGIEQSNAAMEKELDVQLGWHVVDDTLQARTGPRATTVALAKARARGESTTIMRFLEQKEHELRMETQRKSLPQVASGLRSWHAFATCILDYDESATLPPQNAQDICSWICTFRCAATAANYVAHVRWACKEFKKGTGWNDPTIGSLLKAMRKVDLRTRLAFLPERLRIAEVDIHRLITFAWERGDGEFGVLALWSYHFLFRVADEGIPLEMGSPCEAAGRLPEGRHSSVWSDELEITVRLKSRKHRPQGSLLTRRCECGADGDSRLCPVHAMNLHNGALGNQIFPGMTQTVAQRKLRRYLTLLSVPGATDATLKSFRASRATNLALQGKPLHKILQAGEWRSQALLNYASEDSLDRGQVLASTLENSDDEAC